MTDTEFDQAIVKAAFEIIAERGWDHLTMADAARRAGQPLDRARARFPGKSRLLMRFGRLADQSALASAGGDDLADAPHRDRLFDIVMRRIDALQAHRAGMLALFRALPRHPGTALMLGSLTLGSMAWLLDGAGIPTNGPKGALRVQGMLAVWLYTVRAWQKDDSADLPATMAALDRALDRAEQAEASICPSRTKSPATRPDDVPVSEADFMEPAPPMTEPPPL